MKLQTVEREVLKGGAGQSSEFTIEATAKAFKILSSGLYSNKIRAVIRELSCNAFDAHTAAKNPKPIEVYLPTTLKPTFIVKDNGTGLTDFQIRGYLQDAKGNKYSLETKSDVDLEKVPGLYNSYFKSTKTTSDDFVGALGLGSKSPLAYVSNFLVESRVDGEKRMYSIFINESGIPTVTLMSTEKADESNGMTITLAVKRDDIYRFSEEAKSVFMYFNPKPIVKGAQNFSAYEVKHTVKGANWKVRSTDYGAKILFLPVL